MDEEKRQDWDYQLNMPIPGREKQQTSEALAEQEGADFMAAMQQHAQLVGKK